MSGSYTNLIGKLKLLVERSELLKQELNVVQTQSEEIRESNRKQLSCEVGKLNVISDIVDRRSLKVVFVGRTSSGKSTVINALLGQTILPSGVGHTTKCFVEVRGSSKENPFILLSLPNGEEHSLELGSRSLMEMVRSMEQQSMDPGFKIRIFLPRKKSPIFYGLDDIVLVDTPGIDVAEISDLWMDDVGLDADLFVWVMNGESTVMLKEKQFFLRVAEQLSKPNVLVAINRWDCAAEEEEYFIHAALTQHTERIGQFLHRDLKNCSDPDQARNKIFFVSAKEVLSQTVDESEREEDHTPHFLERRNENWDKFANELRVSLTSAHRGGRFINHLETSIQIAQDLSERNHQLLKFCNQKYSTLQCEMIALGEELDKIQTGMTRVTALLKQSISDMLVQVELLVANEFEKEVDNIDDIIFAFKPVFHSDKIVGEAFLHHLISEIEENLGNKLNRKLTADICDLVEKSQTLVKEKVSEILPESKRRFLDLSSRRMPIDFKKFINAKPYLENFQAETVFHFPWTPNFIFLQYRKGTEKVFDWDNSASDHDQIVESRVGFSRFAQEIVSFAFGTPGASTGGFILFGVISHCLSWRTLGAMAAMYASLYCVERLKWNLYLKPRQWKKQFAHHAKDNLRKNMSAEISCSAKDACQLELSSMLILACSAAESAGLEVKSELDKIYTEHGRLQEVMERLNDAISSTNEVAMDMGTFKRTLIAQ